MADRLVPLPATQVARVGFLVPARPMISEEKLALFCNPASGGRLQALQLHCIVGFVVCGDFGGGWTVGADPCQVPSLTLKSKQTKARVFPHFAVWVCVELWIRHGKVFLSLSLLTYSKKKMCFRVVDMRSNWCTWGQIALKYRRRFWRWT
jgi:hypothetical protein